MRSINFRQLLTILVTLLTIVVNILANALPLNGQSTGEISDRFSIFFVPAGYVFSIWGLIYLGMIAFTIYQALPAQRENELLKKISPAYWIGNIANAIWIFLWHYEFFPLTLIAMLTLLASLLYITIEVSKVRSKLNNSQKWFVQLPFSIYLGWISVATIANISQVLFYIGWGGFGISPEAWTVIMLLVATTLGILMLARERAVPYALVLVWAFVGIALKQTAAPVVANTAWVTAALLTVCVMFILFLRLRSGSTAKVN